MRKKQDPLREEIMTARLHLMIAACAVAVGCFTSAHGAEIDQAIVKILPPDQFKWRDPTDQAQTNQTILFGDPNKEGSLYININKFKAGRFGNAHHHPNDRFITVIAGAAWRGTGPVVDPNHATRVPKGTF